MGKAANRSKTKWGATRYRQVKISADPEIAAAFKLVCEAAGVSTAGELSRFMPEYCAVAKKRKPAAPGDGLSTRRKRRGAVAAITRNLEQVRDAETRSHEKVPENLRWPSDCEAIEESLVKMEEAIEALEAIYQYHEG